MLHVAPFSGYANSSAPTAVATTSCWSAFDVVDVHLKTWRHGLFHDLSKGHDHVHIAASAPIGTTPVCLVKGGIFCRGKPSSCGQASNVQVGMVDHDAHVMPAHLGAGHTGH
jgi:hypothetical protein